MPYSSNGQFTLVPSYFASTGETITTAQHNPPLEDLAAGLSQALVRDGRAPMTGPLNMNGFKASGLAPATNPGDAVRLDQVPVGNILVPAGTIVFFAGAAPPSGWMLCAGQAISRTTYANLFAVLGTTYGAGDGATTFNVPDGRGYVPAGKDNMGGTAAGRLTSPVDGATLGAVGGSQNHTLTLGQIPSHNHGGATGSEGAHSHAITFSRRTNATGEVGVGANPLMGAHTPGGLPTPENSDTSSVAAHTHSIASAGGGEAHPNVQPTIVLNMIIRTGL